MRCNNGRDVKFARSILVSVCLKNIMWYISYILLPKSVNFEKKSVSCLLFPVPSIVLCRLPQIAAQVQHVALHTFLCGTSEVFRNKENDKKNMYLCGTSDRIYKFIEVHEPK